MFHLIMGDGMADQSVMDAQPRRKNGRHPEKALSAAQVRSISSPGRYSDGHGLFLRVDDSGARYWVQRIVIRGKRTEIGIGAANLVGLADAREVALANRKLAREGGHCKHGGRQRPSRHSLKLLTPFTNFTSPLGEATSMPRSLYRPSKATPSRQSGISRSGR